MTSNRIIAMMLISAVTMGISAQIATSTVESDYISRVKRTELADFTAQFKNRNLSEEQIEGLKVLYAYMPLPDLVDYSADFYLENVDYALKARYEMPWGRTVPEKEFRHFVLPIRVNNESLDGHRRVFYEELKERVKNLSMADAILEINHWCHEKVTYQPSDSRTHSPLATCYTAIGRCGEESTFTVAALRAMGIPARQIYTPRWAHTDDNHAWVEAWADGKWYFLGACEPEPVLNLGWFNAPASRGMLMTTRVFGNYEGDEEVLSREDGYTNINVTSNYAPTDTISVTVVDENDNKLDGIKVSFRIYNYAEFYALASKTTGKSGTVSLSTGLGDLLIWATDGTRYGFLKASVEKDKSVRLQLLQSPSGTYSDDIYIVPPSQSNDLVAVTAEQAENNNRRKVEEDALRNRYTATFITQEQAAEYSSNLNLDYDRLYKVLTDARGNHKVITSFLASIDSADRERALRLVESLSVKDRSDITAEILNDQIKADRVDSPLYDQYILNPRVDVESLSVYREYFKNKYAGLKDEYRKHPDLLVSEVSRGITIVPDWYPSTVRMSPVSVDRTKVANEASRNVYFVAVARSIGIPARIDPVTGKTQYVDANNKWVDVTFDIKQISRTCSNQGALELAYTKAGHIDDPKYYTHFTISRIENGEPSLYEYPEDASWSNTFKDGIRLDEGQYILTTGQRMANGGVLAHNEIFQVKGGETTNCQLTIRQDTNEVQVVGNFNAENIYHDIAANIDRSIISTTGRGYYVLGLIAPNHEPSNHALRDIASLKDDFDKWGKSIILLFEDDNAAARFDEAIAVQMPIDTTYGIDGTGRIASEVKDALNLDKSDLPIFLIADTFNRIVFVFQGYTIGLGEQILNVIHRVE